MEFKKYVEVSALERHTLLGWALGKKCLPIDSGIMGAYAEIYRRLLEQKNLGPYFIIFWAPGIDALWYCKHYNGSFSQLQMGINENFH